MASVITDTLWLRPGTPVLRRDTETLQVGLAPPLSVRLTDRPEVADLLTALQCGQVPDPLDEPAAAALDSLRAAGLVINAPAGASRTSLAPALAQFGEGAVRRVRQRATHRLGVIADLPSQAVLADLLEAAGIATDPDAATTWLMVSAGEIPRSQLDPLQRAGVPHLVVSGRQGSRRLGPFVEPGHTACLRCVDAHEAIEDPRRPFLVEQAAHADPPADPVDPVLDQLALSWAVRDLARYFEGDEPSTWSTTVEIGPTGPPVTTRWLRHPHCGCAWDTLVDFP